VPYQSIDVLADQSAAEEMVRRSGQYGVPVIVAGADVIVGFDQPRLERLAERVKRQARTPRFGLRARDVPGGGVEVGGARPGSPAEHAGFLPGDILESIDGNAIRTMRDLEATLPALRLGVPLVVGVRRDGRAVSLRLTL
jgi:S1-C subfamily serine protease